MHHPEAGIRLQVHRVKDQWSLGNEVAQNMAENITSLGPLRPPCLRTWLLLSCEGEARVL